LEEFSVGKAKLLGAGVSYEPGFELKCGIKASGLPLT
jgi:hypothetical protein